MAGECFNAVSILQYVANALNSDLHESRLLSCMHYIKHTHRAQCVYIRPRRRNNGGVFRNVITTALWKLSCMNVNLSSHHLAHMVQHINMHLKN